MEKPKQKRNRRPKACQPCRDRKVRCDQEEPCDTCIRRGHPDLCVYGSQRPALAGTAAVQGSSQSQPTISWSSPTQDALHLEQSFDVPINDVPSSLQVPTNQNEIPEDDTNDELIQILNKISSSLSYLIKTDRWTGETVFLGRNCSATFFTNFSHPQTKIPISDTLMPFNVSWGAAFGLTNRTTLHPFGSLWTAAGTTNLKDILQALPATEICMTYHRTYQKVVAPFYPFESRLCVFLPKLAELGLEAALEAAITDGTFRDAAWYGMFFGILAAGCQFSDADVKERLPRTRVFVACAFECLRLANLYGCPSTEVIQTLLLIASTIANDCNPGVALTLLGLITQQARSLGLHVPQTSGVVHPLWKAIMSLESTLSLAFDRPPVSSLPNSTSTSAGTISTFHDSMHDLHALIFTFQNTTTNSQPNSSTIKTTISNLDTLTKRTSTLPTSTTIQSRLEYLFQKTHSSNFHATLLRHLSLDPTTPSCERKLAYESMLIHLRTIITSFLELRNLLSPLALTSWSILHCTMSSACILAALSPSEEDRDLLLKLRGVLKTEVERLDAQGGVIERSSLPYGSWLDAFSILVDGVMKEGWVDDGSWKNSEGLMGVEGLRRRELWA
ncbi:Multidrug resistance regulator 1 [Pseudocercospora fuligena]|uniref:Multidrug resistance regulator 1 n=1 Tax=Pseudocercospora fuligena TaxID=685502 RepID=A0A8H6RHF7_9PEZI|nr:Multidrug resistance regulator 1 [Pseudocercospora fuligena]